jgi:hypothetical protein
LRSRGARGEILQFTLLAIDGGVEQILLDPGQVGVCRVPPVECAVQPGAPQQVVVITPRGMPRCRRGFDRPQRARALGILLEPGVEARPRGGDGFVRDHDGVAIECHQARHGQLFEHSTTAGIREERVGRDTSTRRGAICTAVEEPLHE